MTRNRLICALSKAVVVIESGAKRNTEGKLSGTFNTGLTALEMELPLFVLDPTSFEKPPQGNIDLIRLGGRKLNPRDGARDILRHLKAASPKERNDSEVYAKEKSYLQLNLLPDVQLSAQHRVTAP